MTSNITAVTSDQAPAQRAFYSHAKVANGFVFCSGQLPKDKSGQLVEGTVQDRAHQCIRNLKAVVEAAGSSLERIVSVNVFLADMDNFERVNEVYLEYFSQIKPSRTCVAVKNLPEFTDVEMNCVAGV